MGLSPPACGTSTHPCCNNTTRTFNKSTKSVIQEREISINFQVKRKAKSLLFDFFP
jgi:hypothetical protein